MIVVSGRRSSTEYEVVFDGDSENAYGALYGRSLTADGTDHIDTLIKPMMNCGPLTVRIQLGKTNTAAGNTVTLKNFIVEAVDLAYKDILPAAFSYKTDISQSKFVNVLPRDFSYDTGVNVFEQHDGGYTQSVSADGDSATLNIKSAPKSERKVWNSKLLIRTGFTPKPGQKYLVTYDIEADKDQTEYETCYDGATENAYGAIFGQSLTGGSKTTVSHRFTPKNGHGPLVLRFQLGNTDDASGNVIKVSNIQIKAVTSTATDLGDIDYTTGINVWEKHGDGLEQSLTTTDTTAKLNVTKERSDGGVWSSLLFINTGVKPEAGKRYRVISTVASEKAIGDFEVLCDNGGTAEGYGNSKGLSVDAGGTTTVTTDFTAPESGCNDLTLRYQLGNSPADNTVTVSDIQVCELSKTKLTEVKLTDFAYPLTTEPGLQKNSFDLWTDDSAEAALTGDGNSSTVTVYKPSDDWHVKLYVQPKYKIEKGETYTVSMDVDNADGHKATFKNANGDGEEGFGTEEISGGKLTHTFTADQTGDMEVVLLVGNVNADTAVTVSNFKITKLTEDFFPSEFSTTYPKVTPGSSDNGSFFLEANEGAQAEMTGDGNSATATVTKPGDDWHVKFYVKPEYEIKEGETYRVSMDVSGANGRWAAFKNRDGEGEVGFGTEEISGGKLTHTFTANQTGTMEVLLKIGNVDAGTKVKVSNVKIEKLVDKDKDITPGSINYWLEPPAGGADATRDGQSITVDESTGVDWHIKFYVQPGIELQEGKSYKVSMDVSGADGCNVAFKNLAVEGEEGFGTGTVSSGKLTHTITAGKTGKLEVILKLGNLASGTKVTVSNVKITEATKDYDAVELSGFKYPLVVPESVEPGTFFLETNEGAEAKLSGDGSSYATATVTKPGDDWHVKLYVQPGLTIENGKQYKVSMDVSGADGRWAAFKNRDGSGEEGFGTEEISDGKLTHTFTATHPHLHGRPDRRHGGRAEGRQRGRRRRGQGQQHRDF